MTTIHRGLADVRFDRSRITEIDPVRGELRHFGYSAAELARQPFEKMCWLMFYGEWPSETQAHEYRTKLAHMRRLPAGVEPLIDELVDAAPHDVLRTCLSYLGCGRKEVSRTREDRREELEQWVVWVPRIIAAQGARREGRDFPEPNPCLDHSADFLAALVGRDSSDAENRAIDSTLALHADHGANASSFAARVAVSTEASSSAGLCAAISTFPGRLHGGAVASVLELLDTFGDREDVRAFVAERRRTKRPIPGFGHRVYRGADPRLEPFRQWALVLAKTEAQRRELRLLDDLVTEMASFARFGIGPNVDLYASLVYRLLGIPDDFAISIYMAGRCLGWAAQILEQLEHNVLIRPRLAYEGVGPRRLPDAAA